VGVSHQSLYEVHLLCSGHRADRVVEEHGEQLRSEPLLLTSAAAGAHHGGLRQSQHPERRVDGED